MYNVEWWILTMIMIIYPVIMTINLEASNNQRISVFQMFFIQIIVYQNCILIHVLIN